MKVTGHHYITESTSLSKDDKEKILHNIMNGSMIEQSIGI